MCRWDLSPAILMLFPADWDCKSPPPRDSSMRRIGTWFWQLQAWQTVARAGPAGAALPKHRWGERQKEKELKCWCFMVCIQSSPSAGHGECSPRSSARWGELSTFPSPSSTFSWLSLRNSWNHLPPWAMLLKVTERALIWGKNQVCLPWPWWLVFQNESPETGNSWELGIPKHPCGPGDLYSAISTSCQRKDRKSSEKLKITFRLSHKISIKIKT